MISRSVFDPIERAGLRVLLWPDRAAVTLVCPRCGWKSDFGIRGLVKDGDTLASLADVARAHLTWMPPIYRSLLDETDIPPCPMAPIE